MEIWLITSEPTRKKPRKEADVHLLFGRLGACATVTVVVARF